jgi:hypothetical protein
VTLQVVFPIEQVLAELAGENLLVGMMDRKFVAL